jgi:hypothetical protein
MAGAAETALASATMEIKCSRIPNLHSGNAAAARFLSAGLQ